MRHNKDNFRHESLQDAGSIQDLLKAIAKGLSRGRLEFSDDGGEIVLSPEGLLKLKVVASSNEGQERVDVRVSWQRDAEENTGKRLKVGSGD